MMVMRKAQADREDKHHCPRIWYELRYLESLHVRKDLSALSGKIKFLVFAWKI